MSDRPIRDTASRPGGETTSSRSPGDATREDRGTSAGTLGDPSAGDKNYLTLIRDLLKTSGIYAIASFASPIVALVLSPFLAHHLTRTQYGALAVLTTVIALTSGITQLGMGSGFFRAYSFEYETEHDRLGVVATVIVLLSSISIPVAVCAGFAAPWLAEVLLGNTSFSGPVLIATMVVLVQNLTVPGLAWLRAESRAVIYVALALGNLLVNLVGTILLVGVFQLGIAGALISTGLGYGVIVLATLPIAVHRGGLHLRYDIARSLLAYGLPLGANAIVVWVLQVSDRYLLSHFASLAETASYDVAYKLGSVTSLVVLTPFQLAWPTAQFAIARRPDSPQVFRSIFRWYVVMLAFSTFTLSLLGVGVLYLLFPPVYHSAALVVPVIALSTLFSGSCTLIGLGIGLQRNTSLALLCFVVAAVVNVALNLIWIPRYGAMGAAVSTLVAYIVLVAVVYVVAQRVYPVPFEMGRYATFVLVGIVTYAGCYQLVASDKARWGWPVAAAGAIVYGAWLVVAAGGARHAVRILRNWRNLLAMGRTIVGGSSATNREYHAELPQAQVCMLVLGPARSDVRVMREARTLAEMGLLVTIVDIEHDHTRPYEEDMDGVRVRHVTMSRQFVEYYEPTHLIGWLAFKVARILRGTLAVLRTRADVYHAHDVTALPACYLVTRLRRKPLIYDAHELPLVDPHVASRHLLYTLSSSVLKLTIPACSAVITVSASIAQELRRRYGHVQQVTLRNIPMYQAPHASDRLRRHLGLRSETQIVLYQGGLQANRELRRFVYAGKHIASGIVLVMMGQGPAQPELEALIAQEGVADRVKIIPPVPYEELLTWTASANIGVVLNPPDYSLNVKMSLPNKVFEYLMAGVPVLASPLDEVNELLRRYQVGRTLDSLDPEDIGHAITAMLAGREELTRMREHALAATRRDLRWEVERKNLIGLYQRLLGMQDEPSPSTELD